MNEMIATTAHFQAMREELAKIENVCLAVDRSVGRKWTQGRQNEVEYEIGRLGFFDATHVRLCEEIGVNIGDLYEKAEAACKATVAGWAK